MTRIVVGCLALLVLLPALEAWDKPEKLTPEQQYRRLIRELRKASDEFEKAKEGSFDISKFEQGFLALAKNNPKTRAAVDALTWLLAYSLPEEEPQSPRAQAVRILLRDYVESERMESVCQAFGLYKLGIGDRKLLHAVLEKNSHRSATAQACLMLASYAEGDIRLAPELKKNLDEVEGHEELMGKEFVQALIKAKPEELKKRVEVLYERMAKDFADVPRTILLGIGEEITLAPSGYTFGEFAKAKLEALRHPVLVGKPAPEIEGKDIEGKKFKLSDYRGKIVFLVFWGDWGGLEFEKDYFDDERSLVKKMEGKPFALIGVNNDLDRGELKKLMTKEKLPWRTFLDGGSGRGGPISTRWKDYAGPAWFLIDAKGVVRRMDIDPYPDKKAIDVEIDKLVAEVQKKAPK